MSSSDRTVSILSLFTLDRPEWTVEEAAAAIDLSISSAYRHFAILAKAGLITTTATGRYTLGPAIIQYDRQIQLTDPMLQAAHAIMAELAGFAPAGTTVVLCRVFEDTVLCIHQVLGRGPQSMVSYERGRPMPLFRGATSKVILAHLPPRRLRRLYDAHPDEIRAAGLGADWSAFKASLARLRKDGHAVAYQEVDPGRVGIAGPILAEDRRVLGSLSYVLPATTDQRTIGRLASLIMASCREIEDIMRGVSDGAPARRNGA